MNQSQDNLERVRAEIESAHRLFIEGHPDRSGLMRAMEDWLIEELLILEGSSSG